jgi:dTDP-glucose 4,6-dehydratase
MRDPMELQLRRDCLASLANAPGLVGGLKGHRIAVVGGTGFVGSWLAEAVAALNDDLGCNLRLDLLGRSAAAWHSVHEHLKRDDIQVHAVDARSAIDLPRDTTMVLFAAGIADPRVQASDPHRVFETNILCLNHTLAAASRLENIHRFANISSGLVLGAGLPNRGLAESDLGLLDFTKLHNLYAATRRASEGLAGAYAGQHRLPLSTARAFTFLGPYQPLDAPWAVNNFIRDAISGNDIRIHGDGAARRSYLYGSDVACWLLSLLLKGADGQSYNIGGTQPVSHAEAASLVAGLAAPTPKLIYTSQSREEGRHHDFYPELSNTMKRLGVQSTFDPRTAIERAMCWHANRIGAARRVRLDA